MIAKLIQQTEKNHVTKAEITSQLEDTGKLVQAEKKCKEEPESCKK